MSEPVFCGRCKHYGWSYDVEICRPWPPVAARGDELLRLVQENPTATRSE